MIEPLHIVHDPGHGGADDRGIEHGGIVEAEWTLQIARDCEDQLSHWHIEQSLTRCTDSPLGLGDRGSIAEEAAANLTISHHVNGIHYPDGRANPSIDGLMVFYRPGCYISREVAAAFMRAAPAELRRRKPLGTPASPGDWTRRAHAVLRHHEGRPAVLIEWGFATAPRDAAALTSEASRPALVTACQAGVARLCELV